MFINFRTDGFYPLLCLYISHVWDWIKFFFLHFCPFTHSFWLINFET